MQSCAIVRGMIDYHYEMFNRLWESINTLNEAQFVADVPYSHGSIRNHMVHVAQVDNRWMRGLQGLPDDPTLRYKPSQYATVAATQALCESVAGCVTAFVSGLDEAALHCQLAHMPMPTWKVLLHMVNHGTDHRAQVLRSLHDFGAPTFEQDVLFHSLKD